MRSLASIAAFCLIVLWSSGTAPAAPLRLYAAGSLTAAFTEMVKAFPAATGAVEPPVFGPSGVLRERIEKGEPADLLASADMEHPRALARQRGNRSVVMFARNRICALAKASLGMTPDNLLDRLLDPQVRLATSTPGADPGGDYVWAVFQRAERIRPGAQAALQAKARKLVGGPGSVALVSGRGAVQGIFLADKADVMLGYCSSAKAIVEELPGLVSVPVPPDLAVGPAYGMVVLSDDPTVSQFALFVLSERGQAILAKYGFEPVGASER